MAKSVGHRVARQFAQALDGEDYPTVKSLLAADCVYESPSGMLRGQEDILKSYRENGEQAHHWFGTIAFESQIIKSDDISATILFIDHLTHSKGKHTYRCQQKLQFNSQGKIFKIIHQEIETERQLLDEFFAQCGLER